MTHHTPRGSQGDVELESLAVTDQVATRSPTQEAIAEAGRDHHRTLGHTGDFVGSNRVRHGVGAQAAGCKLNLCTGLWGPVAGHHAFDSPKALRTYLQVQDLPLTLDRALSEARASRGRILRVHADRPGRDILEGESTNILTRCLSGRLANHTPASGEGHRAEGYWRCSVRSDESSGDRSGHAETHFQL